MKTMEVDSIQFGILSDDDIANMAVCVIDKTTLAVDHGSVYDPRMGCVQNGDMAGQLCITCGADIWECSGHFGMINLNTPIILFHKQVVTLLKCFCLNCYRIRCSTETFRSFDSAFDYLQNLANCNHCGTITPDIKFVVGDATILMTILNECKEKKVKELSPQFIKRIFDMISDDDVKLLCLDPTMVHPRNYVLTKFPVVPTCCRPKMMAGDNISDDDLTLILIDILKANRYLETHEMKDDHVTYKKMLENIKIKTMAYCDNSRGKATHSTNHKPLSGIKERINCKNGHMRQNLAGKRVDRTGRTVLGPDPTVKLNEIVIPQEIANILTIPEYVTSLNIDILKKLVNEGKASTIVKKSGVKINVAHARVVKGTKLVHGDTVIRIGFGEIPVLDCKMNLLESDIVRHATGQMENARLARLRTIDLDVGDVVERYLKDGDPLFLNRQPTLHRNGMLGMRAVIKPGRTFRFNLAITKGFNADFDGDEGNIYCCKSLCAQAELKYVVDVKDRMLSAQTNKPEQCMVQDSLLAAYLMTSKPQPMAREDFQNCLFRSNKCHLFSHQHHYDARDLFQYILPSDFNVTYPKLVIKKGKLIEGYFDKTSLGSTPRSIIRLLHIEYDKHVAADFIDNMQFLTHAWLEINPFSIGLDDCFPNDDDSIDKIIQNVQKYFLEAKLVSSTVKSKNVKEAKINLALNSAKDIGLRIAMESLAPDNKIRDTVVSGSKGDYFNIAQITGLLGQQNISNCRVEPTLTNHTRTMIHYPYVISENEQQFESRGFISSSFLNGMNPKEMFFHAMTGRKGITDTALGTAVHGYIQRSIDKLNEDLQVAYDGTVVDAGRYIHQFAYGNTGFDPSLVTLRDGLTIPVEIDRLCERLNNNCTTTTTRTLTQDEIDDIVTKCEWKRPPSVPTEISESIWTKHETYLRRELGCACIADEKYDEFKNFVIDKYLTCLATPGECVGIIGAQSIGEMQTQSNLDTFHTAGKLQYSGISRFEEILKITKKLQNPTMTIYFKTKYKTADELRQSIGSSIVGFTLADLIVDDPVNKSDNVWCVKLRKKLIFSVYLTLDIICDVIESETDFMVECDIVGPLSIVFTINSPTVVKKRKGCGGDDDTTLTTSVKRKQVVIDHILAIQVCGIDGIKAMHLDRDEHDEFYIVTEGSNFKKMLCHPLVDIKRLYTNDIWGFYESLGIAATKAMLLADVKRCISGVNDCHPRLLVDKMTWSGKPLSITRYTMKTNNVGPISKSTYEQCMDFLLSSAHKGELDDMKGVSSSFVTGKHVPIGTNCMTILADIEALEYQKFIKLIDISDDDDEDDESIEYTTYY
jgi:DNA-directed RNA polymerase beta' subunit